MECDAEQLSRCPPHEPGCRSSRTDWEYGQIAGSRSLTHAQKSSSDSRAAPTRARRSFFSEILIVALDPQARVIISSGYTHDAVEELLAAGALEFIEKPYREAQLLQTVASALAP